MINYILFFSLGTLFGVSFSYFAIKVSNFIITKRFKDNYDKFFLEIKKLIGTKYLKFVSRYNDILTFSAETGSNGDVYLYINIKRRDVTAFKDDKCIYTTYYADPNLIESIVEGIENRYEKKINDCFLVSGHIVDKASVKKINPNIEDFLKKKELPNFKIDDILDRISQVGMENLTPEEKNFLKNYKPE